MSFFEDIAMSHVADIAMNVVGNVVRSVRNRNENRRIQEQNERAERERSQAEQRMENMLSQQRQENRNLSNSLRRLNDEVERNEREYRRQLQEMNRRHNEDMERQNQRIRDESNRLQQSINQNRAEIQNVRRHTEEEFENMRNVRERDLEWARDSFNQTNQRINDIQQQLSDEKADQQEIAEYWIQQAQRIRSEIRENYRPEKFESQKWESLNQDIRAAEANIDVAPQAAIAQGYGAFRDASELRSVLAAQEIRWQETLSAVRTLEEQVLTNMEDAKEREFEVRFEGEEPTTDNNGVDYWTYGQLSVLENRVHEAQDRLNADTENLTTEQLEEFEREFAGFLEENALLENAARSNLTMAIARYDMAERIGEVLGDEWLLTVADGDYFREEPRDEYHATFFNPEKNEEAVVVINPEPNEDGIVTNHAEVLIRTASNNAEHRQRINDSIVNALSQNIEGFRLPCSERYGTRTNEEIERLGNIEAVTEGRPQALSEHCRLDEKGRIKPSEQKKN